jgi:hypothetical protein
MASLAQLQTRDVLNHLTSTIPKEVVDVQELYVLVARRSGESQIFGTDVVSIDDVFLDVTDGELETLARTGQVQIRRFLVLLLLLGSIGRPPVTFES